MFKRVGALATIPVVLGLVASLALAGTVLAAPWTSVNVTQTGPCDFLVWYSWGGQGHGSSLKAVVEIGAFDQDGNSSGAGYFDMTPTSGRDGNISHTFHVSTGSADPIKVKGPRLPRGRQQEPDTGQERHLLNRPRARQLRDLPIVSE